MSPLEMLASESHPLSIDAAKSESAYKTISEVSEELDVPQHVLRFWESRFPEIKPSRMRGSRRYYRPEDLDMLKRIKALLYAEGYTIDGARKVVKGEKVPSIVKKAEYAAVKAAKRDASDKKRIINELRILKAMLSALL